jgi:hypothetical protein
MRCPRLVPVACVVTLAVVPTALWASQTDPLTAAHVRALNKAATEVLADAREHCPTIRQLIHDLDQSDVVAYLVVTPFMKLATADTRFLSAAGGFRYVVMTVNALNDTETRAAWLAHELQHALEVAHAPEVTDTASLEALYRRIGRPASDNGWETEEAVQTGHMAELEYAAAPRTARARPPRPGIGVGGDLAEGS